MRYAEINHSKRMWFLLQLREWIREHGSHNIVYMDESGFEAQTYRPNGWATRGRLVHGKVTGNKKKGRTNLIMAQRGKEWLAPFTFTGSCHHEFVTEWFRQCLIPELKPNSLIVIDNAPFHNKPQIREVLEKYGHTLLPLPPYSPDFNPIEKTFATIKKRRQATGQSIDNVMDNYKLE